MFPAVNSTPQTWTPIHQWTTLQTDLATNPDADHLLNTYGVTAWQTLEHDLQRHLYLQARDTFDHAYTHTLWHRTLQAARNDGHLTDHTYKDLQTITGVPAARLRDWHLDIKQPHLERTLQIHDTARQQWEQELPNEAQHHILDPSIVYHAFKPLLDHPEHQTTENLASAIETLYHHNPTQRLTIAELKPYHKTGPQDLRTIAHTITDLRTELTDILNQHLNLANTQEELRVAIDHDTLYLWRKTINSDHWLNAYKNEILYLKPDIKEQLITSAQRHLNVNKQELGQLIDQLTDHTRERTYNPRAIPYELYPTKWSKYLYGDTLHLIIDTTHQSFTTIKPQITQIGRIANLEQGGGIQNPRFPEGEKLNEIRARLLAIALSDCHINKNTHVLTYHENDPNRMRYSRSLFQQLGDCTYQLETLKGKRNRLNVTAPVGRLLEYWGVPRGDKHLTPNVRIPETIRKGTPEVKHAYLSEVIPEDGFFIIRAGAYKFGIKRAQILDAGSKTEMYEYPSKISLQHKELITKYDTERTQTIRDEKSRNEITLTKGRLKELTKNAETQEDRQLAQQLHEIIKANPSQLLKDEKELAESLGIKMQTIFKELKLQESGRISTTWEIYTKTSHDTHRWATIAEPSSGEKQSAVKEWVIRYQEKNSQNSTGARGKTKLRWDKII